MVSLTRIRSGPGAISRSYRLMSLAQDVRAILGSATRITYAADWTEYGAHVRDGGNELRFPLDPLWAHPAIDAIGIDYYPPISDWRDGGGHLDAALARSIYDVDYLCARLGAGEGFDWYYADDAGRAAQSRLPITDGAYGKPWVYRAKDLVSWWSEPHVERVAGVEIGATAYMPMAQADLADRDRHSGRRQRGRTKPNLFPDMKSSEGAFPAFLTGACATDPPGGGGGGDVHPAASIPLKYQPMIPPIIRHSTGSMAGPMVAPERPSLSGAWGCAGPSPPFRNSNRSGRERRELRGPWHWLNGRLEGPSISPR